MNGLQISEVSAELAFAVRDSETVWLKGHIVFLTHSERVTKDLTLVETDAWILN